MDRAIACAGGNRYRKGPSTCENPPLLDDGRQAGPASDWGKATSALRNAPITASPCRPHPDLVVVEGGAAIGRRRVGAGQHVDALAALMRAVGPDALGDDDAALTPSNSLACSTTSPRVLPISTRSPAAMPSSAASSGWISSCGLPSRFLEPGVSVKVELRKLRAGEVASRNGMLLVGDLDQVDMVGKSGQLGNRPVASHAFRRPVGRERAGPVRAEAELAVGMGEAVEEMRCLEIRLQVDPALSP